MSRRTAALIAALGVAAALLTCCRAPRKSEPSDWERLGLSGRVQKMVVMSAHSSGEGGELVTGGYAVSVFDPQGWLIEERYYSAQGELAGSRSPQRDRSGRTMGEQGRDADGGLEQRVVYRHDAQGRLAREQYHDSSGALTGEYSYQYDDQGRLQRRLMEASYSDGSRRSNEVLYRYDEAGRLVEEIYREEGLGRIALRVAYAYEGGRRMYRSDYLYGNWLQFRSFYVYDTRDNVVQEVSYQIPESEDSAVYEPLTRAEQFPRRLLSSRTRWEYTYFPGAAP